MAARNSFERKNLHLLLSLFAVGALAAQGCTDAANPVPSTTVVTGGNGGSGNTGGSAGKGGKGGTSSGGTSTGGSTGNEGGTGDVSSGGTGGSSASGGKGGSSASGGKGGSSATGGTGAVGEGGEGGVGAEGGAPPEPVDCDVRGDRNCYRCEPHAISPAPIWPESVNEQFHNACSDAACSPFDNASRIEGWTGTLPAP